jgi:Zn-dependent protease
MPGMNIEWGLFGLWYVVFLLSLTLHEGAHALAAHLGGDDTAYHGGQVTLNPVPHMQREPMGTLLVPVLSFLYFGWVMGWASTPYDPVWAGRHPRRAGLMALAGPGSNFALALAALVAIKILLAAGVLIPPATANFHQVVAAPDGAAPLMTPLAYALSLVLTLNVILGCFNLLPMPPLDGSGVLEGFLPGRAADRWRDLTSAPGARLVGLLAVWYLFGRLIAPLFGLILRLVHPGLVYS